MKYYEMSVKTQTILKILKRKYEQNPEAYYFSGDIASQTEYQQLEGVSRCCAIGVGGILSDLFKAGYARFAVVLRGTTPTKCYQITQQGLDCITKSQSFLLTIHEHYAIEWRKSMKETERWAEKLKDVERMIGRC